MVDPTCMRAGGKIFMAANQLTVASKLFDWQAAGRFRTKQKHRIKNKYTDRRSGNNCNRGQPSTVLGFQPPLFEESWRGGAARSLVRQTARATERWVMICLTLGLFFSDSPYLAADLPPITVGRRSDKELSITQRERVSE